LRWPRHALPDHLPPSAATSTHLEFVVDFELSSGLKLGADGACGTSWKEKASTLIAIIKSLARIYTIVVDDKVVGYKEAFQPRTNVPALVPLGAPVLAGFARRPVWVSGRTPQAVAVNLWRARAADRRERALSSSLSSVSTRTRAFAKDWVLNYASFPADDGWRPSALQRLRTQLDEARKRPLPTVASAAAAAAGDEPPPHDDPARQHGRFIITLESPPPRKRMKGTSGQAQPVVPSRTESGDDDHGHAATPLSDDSGCREPPLPSMTREFKRARLNGPLSQPTIPTTKGTSSSAASSSHAAGSNRCKLIRPRSDGGAASSKGRADAKRRRETNTVFDNFVNCGACGDALTYSVCRYLPNSPILTKAWRGAWPGSPVCRMCHQVFCKEFSNK
jgi:hypothetical protein